MHDLCTFVTRTFELAVAEKDRYDCTRSDLIRLGKKADSEFTDDRSAVFHDLIEL